LILGYTGHKQLMKQEDAIHLSIITTFLPLILVVCYGPWILYRAVIGEAGGKGALPTCGRCQSAGEAFHKANPADVFSLDDSIQHPLRCAHRAFTLLAAQSRTSKEERTVIATRGPASLKRPCHRHGGDHQGVVLPDLFSHLLAL
jgi:hypothetical protein